MSTPVLPDTGARRETWVPLDEQIEQVEQPTRARMRTARVRRRRAIAGGAALGAVGLVWAFAALSGMAAPSSQAALPAAVPAVVEALPAPRITAAAPAASICDDPAVQAALSSGDDETALLAAGGGAAFRDAVVAGNAPCVSLSDPARRWVVIDKRRPFDPLEYEPAGLVQVEGLTTLNGGILREDAATALAEMAAAVQQSGAGRLGQLSGYRSYGTQVSTYAENVARGGQLEADASSAKPGFSEHQSGLAADLIPCSGGCGSLDDFGASPEGQWIAENAWRYGFIVRYEEGKTAITGYEAEPWHVRYIGPELATAYHDGGYHSLEEFFGLPAAPDYG